MEEDAVTYITHYAFANRTFMYRVYRFTIICICNKRNLFCERDVFCCLGGTVKIYIYKYKYMPFRIN